MRKTSPTFGKWLSVELSDYNKKQLWVPPDLLTDFLAFSESARVIYKTTELYFQRTRKRSNGMMNFLISNGPENCEKLVSEKDKKGSALERFNLSRFFITAHPEAGRLIDNLAQ